MEHARFRGPILAVLAICLLIAPVHSVFRGTIIYSTDFSSDPDWTTNNPYTNQWNGDLGMFHYFLRDATNTYIFKKIPYRGTSFRLEYDLLPLRTEFQSSFRFGIGDQDMYVNQASIILSEFENSSYGNLIWLRTVDQSNGRREISSYYQSYGGPTVQFSDGTSYHVVLTYDREAQDAQILVTFLENHTTLWGYTVDGVSNMGPQDRIFISTIGDYTNPYNVAEGYLDNVSFVVFSEETGTTALPDTATPRTTFATMTTTPVTVSPPQPTATAVSLLTGIAGLALVAVFSLLRDSRRR